MRRFLPLLTLIFVGCEPMAVGNRPPSSTDQESKTLVEARKNFKSKTQSRGDKKEAIPKPPEKIFSLVKYKSPVGQLPAYLTPDPKDGKKHPAMIWITGGDCNSIGECWENAPADNDQSAAAYRKAGIVMMFPSLRGGNENPGTKEGFLGEVDDVIAAANHLATVPYVDTKRIYLGGHSTGGTLVLLVAESTDQFRAIFSFGPVDDVSGYGPEFNPYNLRDAEEVRLRSPIHWLQGVKNPTFVIEGEKSPNIECLKAMRGKSTNANLHFLPVPQKNHFALLAPMNQQIAEKIVKDNGPKCTLELTATK